MSGAPAANLRAPTATISMLAGISVFGVMGFLVGPVIAALFRTLLDIYGTEFNKQLDLVHHPAASRTAGEGFEI